MTLVRWLLFIPTAMFTAFAVTILAGNLTDWLTGGWPGNSPASPLPYTLGDLLWPIAAIVIGASVAPGYRVAVAALLAVAGIASAILVGGSWSLNWLSDVPTTAWPIGVAVTSIGAVLGVLAVAALNRKRAI